MQTEKPSLRSLLSELQSVSFKWYELAVMLGVHDNELKQIQSQYRNASPNRCMMEALGLWLDTNVHASWSEVVTAVSSSIVGEKHLAGVIQSRYCST